MENTKKRIDAEIKSALGASAVHQLRTSSDARNALRSRIALLSEQGVAEELGALVTALEVSLEKEARILKRADSLHWEVLSERARAERAEATIAQAQAEARISGTRADLVIVAYGYRYACERLGAEPGELCAKVDEVRDELNGRPKVATVRPTYGEKPEPTLYTPGGEPVPSETPGPFPDANPEPLE
jgi:hypothetical protein